MRTYCFAYSILFLSVVFVLSCNQSNDDGDDTVPAALPLPAEEEVADDAPEEEEADSGLPEAGNGFGTSVENIEVTQADELLVLPGRINLLAVTGSGGSLNLIQQDGSDAYSQRLTEVVEVVDEEATEVLDFTNQLLCLFDAMNYTDNINGAAYIADIEESLCFPDGSEFQQPRTMRVNVQVTRDDSAALNVRAWFNFVFGDGPNLTRMRLQAIIGEGASSTNPFGVFRLLFTGFSIDAQGIVGTDIDLQGAVETGLTADGRVRLLYTQSDQGDEGRSALIKSVAEIDVVNGELGGGRIKTSSAQTQGEQSLTAEYDVAYDNDYLSQTSNQTFNGQTQSASVCKSRSEYDVYTRLYELFDAATGDFVDLDAAFVFKVADSSTGEDFLGFVEELGVNIWSSDSGEFEGRLQTGDTVRLLNLQTFEEVPHSMVVAQGQLRRVQTTNVDRTDIDGIEVYLPPPSDSNPSSGGVNSSGLGRFDAATDSFLRISGAEVYGDNNDTRFPLLDTPVSFTEFSVQTENRLILADLGGSNDGAARTVLYLPQWDGSALVGTTIRKREETEFTFLVEQDTALYCFSRCLRPDLTQVQYDFLAANSGNGGSSLNEGALYGECSPGNSASCQSYSSDSPYFDDSSNSSATPHVYRFQVSDKSLYYLGNSADQDTNATPVGKVAWPQGLTASDVPLGAFGSNLYPLNSDPNAQDLFYTYEPADRSFKDVAGVIRSGASQIKRPVSALFVPYVHTADKDPNGTLSENFFNTRQSLSWDGSRLQVPRPTSDNDDGDAPFAFDGDSGFSIAAGTLAGSNDEFRILPVLSDLYFRAVDDANCADLSTDSALELPSDAFLTVAQVDDVAIAPAGEPIYFNGEPVVDEEVGAGAQTPSQFTCNQTHEFGFRKNCSTLFEASSPAEAASLCATAESAGGQGCCDTSNVFRRRFGDIVSYEVVPRGSSRGDGNSFTCTP